MKMKMILPAAFVSLAFAISGCGSDGNSAANDINSLFDENPLDGNSRNYRNSSNTGNGNYLENNFFEPSSELTSYQSPDGMQGSESIYGNYRDSNGIGDNIGNNSGNDNLFGNNDDNIGSNEADGNYEDYYNGFGSVNNNIYGYSGSDFNNVGYTPRSEDNMNIEMNPENLSNQTD